MTALPFRLGWLSGREILSQGLTWLLGIGILFLIWISQFLPFFVDLESEIQLVKDLGLSSMALGAAALAALHATTALSAELEERTAVTLLSKPVGRGAFLAGKYAGILMAATVLFVPWTAMLEYAAWHKASYLQFAYAPAPFDWSVIQGALLAWLEVAVVAAAATALSCVLPPALGLAATAGIFTAGHLMEHFRTPSAWAEFLAWPLRAVLPNLSLFRLTDAFALGADVPGSYLLWTSVYAAAYILAALGAGWVFLRGKDIA